jgi:predicted small secreted protein
MNKRKAIVSIGLAIFAIAIASLLAWAIYSDSIQRTVWHQEINKRIDMEIQNSGIQFNTTQPTNKECYVHTERISCSNENEWQELNASLHKIFEFMKNAMPNDSMTYRYESLSYIYIGYITKTYLGPEFIGYEIYICYTDC